MVNDDWFNDDDLKKTLKLTYLQRLEMLESFNRFILATISDENLKIAQELKKNGF